MQHVEVTVADVSVRELFGERVVPDAAVYDGLFAVFAIPHGLSRDWQVTHVPTKMWLYSSFSRKRAAAFAKYLAAHGSDDWQISDGSHAEDNSVLVTEYKRAVEYARDAL